MKKILNLQHLLKIMFLTLFMMTFVCVEKGNAHGVSEQRSRNDIVAFKQSVGDKHLNAKTERHCGPYLPSDSHIDKEASQKCYKFLNITGVFLMNLVIVIFLYAVGFATFRYLKKLPTDEV